jgi:hypothetical protein
LELLQQLPTLTEATFALHTDAGPTDAQSLPPVPLPYVRKAFIHSSKPLLALTLPALEEAHVTDDDRQSLTRFKSLVDRSCCSLRYLMLCRVFPDTATFLRDCTPLLTSLSINLLESELAVQDLIESLTINSTSMTSLLPDLTVLTFGVTSKTHCHLQRFVDMVRSRRQPLQHSFCLLDRICVINHSKSALHLCDWKKHPDLLQLANAGLQLEFR